MRKHQDPEFLSLYRSGLTTIKMAEVLTVGMGTIRKWVGEALKDGLVERRQREWSVEDTEALRGLYESGMPIADIAKALNRPDAGIEGRVASMKFRRLVGKSAVNQVKWSAEMVSELHKLVDARFTDRQVGLRLGVSDKSVANKRRKLGISPGGPTHPKWTPEKTEKLRALWPHHGTTEIARLMGLTQLQVHTKSLRMELPRKGYPDVRKAADRDYESLAEANRARAGVKTGPRPVKAKSYPAPEIIPDTARPWITRKFGECAYPHGERGNIHSCCKPVIGQSQWCSDHFALCINYDRKAA